MANTTRIDVSDIEMKCRYGIFSLPSCNITPRSFAYFYPTCETEFFSNFSGAENFCLAHGLGQLTHDGKSDVKDLNFRSHVTYALLQKTPNDVRQRSLCDVKC